MGVGKMSNSDHEPALLPPESIAVGSVVEAINEDKNLSRFIENKVNLLVVVFTRAAAQNLAGVCPTHFKVEIALFMTEVDSDTSCTGIEGDEYQSRV